MEDPNPIITNQKHLSHSANMKENETEELNAVSSHLPKPCISHEKSFDTCCSSSCDSGYLSNISDTNSYLQSEPQTSNNCHVREDANNSFPHSNSSLNSSKLSPVDCHSSPSLYNISSTPVSRPEFRLVRATSTANFRPRAPSCFSTPLNASYMLPAYGPRAKLISGNSISSDYLSSFNSDDPTGSDTEQDTCMSSAKNHFHKLHHSLDEEESFASSGYHSMENSKACSELKSFDTSFEQLNTIPASSIKIVPHLQHDSKFLSVSSPNLSPTKSLLPNSICHDHPSSLRSSGPECSSTPSIASYMHHLDSASDIASRSPETKPAQVEISPNHREKKQPRLSLSSPDLLPVRTEAPLMSYQLRLQQGTKLVSENSLLAEGACCPALFLSSASKPEEERVNIDRAKRKLSLKVSDDCGNSDKTVEQLTFPPEKRTYLNIPILKQILNKAPYIVNHVLQHLNPADVLSFSQVNKQCCQIVKNSKPLSKRVNKFIQSRDVAVSAIGKENLVHPQKNLSGGTNTTRRALAVKNGGPSSSAASLFAPPKRCLPPRPDFSILKCSTRDASLNNMVQPSDKLQQSKKPSNIKNHSTPIVNLDPTSAGFIRTTAEKVSTKHDVVPSCRSQQTVGIKPTTKCSSLDSVCASSANSEASGSSSETNISMDASLNGVGNVDFKSGDSEVKQRSPPRRILGVIQSCVMSLHAAVSPKKGAGKNNVLPKSKVHTKLFCEESAPAHSCVSTSHTAASHTSAPVAKPSIANNKSTLQKNAEASDHPSSGTSFQVSKCNLLNLAAQSSEVVSSKRAVSHRGDYFTHKLPSSATFHENNSTPIKISPIKLNRISKAAKKQLRRL